MNEQIQYYINDLYRGLNQAWEEIAILKAKNAELEDKLESAKPIKEAGEKTRKEYPPCPSNITPEFMLEVLDWAKQKGVFDAAVREYRRSRKKPLETNQVIIEKVYREITGLLNGVTTEKYPDSRVGQEFLDCGYAQVRTKDGYIHWSYSTIPWLCFEKWREEHHG